MGESLFRIPHKDVYRNEAGFALDIGGSLAKVVYRSKEDYEKGKPKFDEPFGRLRFKMFPSEERSKIAEFLRTNCDMCATDGIPPLTCATGFNHRSKDMEKSLGVQITTDQEMDCFIRAFRYLLAHKPDAVFEEPPALGLKQALAKVNMIMNIKDDLNKGSEDELAKGNNNEGEVPSDCNGNNNNNVIRRPSLPCLLAMAGSAVGFIWVKGDGSWQIVDGTPLGGKYVLGMANLLTGEKTYERVMELAGKGRSDGVDTHARDMRIEAGGGYEAYPADLLLYAAGKAATAEKDDFRPEDKVASILSITCHSLIQMLHYYGTILGVSNIYLCGNFVESDVVRTHLTREALTRAMLSGPDPDKRIQYKFMKKGGFYGALGAFLQRTGSKDPPKAED